MANIRREFGTHDWRDQRFSQGPGLLCWNCRASWIFELNGGRGPSTQGCLSEIHVSKVVSTQKAGARMRDLEEQEMRLRETRERHDPQLIPKERLNSVVQRSSYTEETYSPEEILDRYRHDKNKKSAVLER